MWHIMKSGAGTYEVYTQIFWCFNGLSLLANNNTLSSNLESWPNTNVAAVENYIFNLISGQYYFWLYAVNKAVAGKTMVSKLSVVDSG